MFNNRKLIFGLLALVCAEALLAGEHPWFLRRYGVQPHQMPKEIVYRDRCSSIGGSCDCSHALPSGLPAECYEGMCFKGYHYGDDSVYCQCHGHVLNDAEFKQFVAQGPLDTDMACSAVPKYGYDGQGFIKLGEELKKLWDQKQLFRQSRFGFGTSNFLTYVHLQDISSAIHSVLLTITSELNTLYHTKTLPTKLLPLVKTYEDPDAPERPCVRFKEMLRSKLGMPEDVDFSPAAQAAIAATCGESNQRRDNLDPCICGNTKKPGVCAVNQCVNPGILRCHCD